MIPNPQRATPRKIRWLAHQPLHRKMMLGIGLLLGLFLMANLLTLNSLQQQQGNRHSASQTYRTLLQIAASQRAAQTSQILARGYMLTPSPAELEQFNQSLVKLGSGLTLLRQTVSDQPLQQSRLDAAHSFAERWQREIVEWGIDPMRQVDATAPEASAMRERIRADYRQHRSVRVDDLIAELDQMAAEEHRQLASRNRLLDARLTTTRAINAIIVLLGILIGLMVVRLTSQLVIRPLRRLTDQMTRLSQADHDFEIRRLDRRDEVGEIARALQVFKQMSLDTEAQNWVRSRVSEISHTLLQATTHKDFAQWLINELVPLCDAGIGLFYSFDDARHRLDLLGSYGLRLSDRTAEHYMPGEGLVGQCASDRKPIILDNVPANYLHIDSGSGEALPSHLAILPVLYRDTLIGVLELASFAPLSALQRQLLDELLPLVALALENLNQAVHTQGLLQQTQEQADELRLSELVMRQQKTTLHESNESLQIKTQELQEQSQRLMASDEELRVQAEELREYNEELRQMTEDLNRQKFVLEDLQQETADKAAALARASQYKSEFLANMSHELRTPLNSLLILSRSLAENESGNLDADQVESAQIINDAGNDLLALINDILDLSKVEAGKMALVLGELTLADLGKRLQRLFSRVASDKGVRFDVTIDPDAPPTIRTDDGKLEQIANNLLSNAFKFTAQGSVELRMGRPADDVTIPALLYGQPLIAVSVSDTGIGIPADRRDAIFNAFEQVDAGTSRQFGGTGLGLALSRRLAHLLGGDIVLRSEPGQGSQFTLLLPEAPREDDAFARDDELGTPLPRMLHQHSDAGPAPDDRESLTPGQSTILIIEDDVPFAKILVDMIRRKGHAALAAADGGSGLELARRYRPTGILLDVGLPDMDGWAVLEQLKADDRTRAIPVHMVSVNDSRAGHDQSGAIGFMTKPVSRESIGAALDQLLHKSAGKPRQLLVVDDDPGSRKAVRAILRGDDVQLDEAGSGHEALEMIRATQYDCVVLDLGMPDMSGLEVLESLASDPSKRPPVVIYSGRDLSQDELAKLRTFADSVVLKGAHSTERLLEEVSSFLGRIEPSPATIPIPTQTPDPLPPRTPAATPTQMPDLAGHQVLLVDDDMRNLFALSKVLRGWGVQVSQAQDGPKALKLLADEAPPELILMDVMMPGMDGYATMQAIRERPELGAVPIIALTAKAMMGDREKCLEMGANDYLSKPIDLDQLAATLTRWLRHTP